MTDSGQSAVAEEIGPTQAEIRARLLRRLPGKRKYAALTDAQLRAEMRATTKRIVTELGRRAADRWEQTNTPPGRGDAREPPDERARREALG